MAQTEQLRTYLMVSRDIPGPPVPSLEEREGPLAAWMSRAGTLCTESRRDCRMEVGNECFPFWTSQLSRLIFQMMGLTMRAGGRIGSGSAGESGECTRDRASALQFQFSRSVGDDEIEPSKE